MVKRRQHFLTIFNDYADKTSLHGMKQISQSNYHLKLSWLFITLVSTGFLCYHIHRTVVKYIESPLQTLFIRENVHAPVIFPDVTFCNMKPISATKYSEYSEDIFTYFQNKWNFFDNWFPEERIKKPNETIYDYEKRLRDVYAKFMTFFAVSESVSYLGWNYNLSVMFCEFNDVACDVQTQFKLIQHLKYWNCFTFQPKSTDLSEKEDLELRIMLYLDNYMLGAYKMSMQLVRDVTMNRNYTLPFKLKDYMTYTNRTFNEIISGNQYETEGLKVFIHRREDYPTGTKYVRVSNGRRNEIEFTQTNIYGINHPIEGKCLDVESSQAPTVSYVTAFGNQGSNIVESVYTKTQMESAYEEIQSRFYKKCSCYSHKFPFKHNTNVLCYFIPAKMWQLPDQTIINQINCHDNTFKEIHSNDRYIYKNAQDFTLCNRRDYSATATAVVWPQTEDYISILDSIIIPHFSKNFSTIIPLTNYSEMQNVNGLDPSRKPQSELILQGLVSRNCLENTSATTYLLVNAWCGNVDHLDKNIAYITIKPRSTLADTYKVSLTYEWPEVLSEIGGTLGLWLGMSLLTFFEIFEVIIVYLFKSDYGVGKKKKETETSNKNPPTCNHQTSFNNGIQSSGESITSWI